MARFRLVFGSSLKPQLTSETKVQGIHWFQESVSVEKNAFKTATVQCILQIS